MENCWFLTFKNRDKPSTDSESNGISWGYHGFVEWSGWFSQESTKSGIDSGNMFYFLEFLKQIQGQWKCTSKVSWIWLNSHVFALANRPFKGRPPIKKELYKPHFHYDCVPMNTTVHQVNCASPGGLTPCKFQGLAARIAQHEFDHLDGVLFPFRVESAKFPGLEDFHQNLRGPPGDICYGLL